MSCAICWEDFTNKVKRINCPSDESCKGLCKDCFIRTINERLIPTCFSCNKEINKDYLYKHLAIKDLNDYNENIAKIMVEKEKQYLPECLNEIVFQNKRKSILVEMNDLKKEKLTINNRLAGLRYTEKIVKQKISSFKQEKILEIDEIKRKSLISSILSLNEQKNEIEKDIKYAKADKLNIVNSYNSMKHDLDYKYSIEKQKEKVNYVIPEACLTPDCRGFLTLEKKCELCNKFFCSSCYKEKNNSHECKEDDIATISLLKKDTKPCPKCNMSISKIDGCDQMFCVVPTCRTTFSWKTGKIETGPTHNPEFFRFMRERGLEIKRNTNDTDCINMFEGNNGYYFLQNLFVGSVIRDELVFQIYRKTAHFRALNILRPRDLSQLKTIDLRFKYLNNDIDETKWIKIMKSRIKANEKNCEVGRLFSLIITSINDILLEYSTEFIKVRHHFIVNKDNNNATHSVILIENLNNIYLPIRKKLEKSFVTISDFLRDEVKCIMKKYKSSESFELLYYEEIRSIKVSFSKNGFIYAVGGGY